MIFGFGKKKKEEKTEAPTPTPTPAPSPEEELLKGVEETLKAEEIFPEIKEEKITERPTVFIKLSDYLSVVDSVKTLEEQLTKLQEDIKVFGEILRDELNKLKQLWRMTKDLQDELEKVKEILGKAE